MINIAKAILAINPKAEVSINDNDINQITWHNGTVPIAKSQIEAMIPIVEKQEEDKLAQQESNKQSAIAKLKALGLDEEEVKAILGV